MKAMLFAMFVALLVVGCGEEEVLSNKTAEDGPSCEACADCCDCEMETPSKVTETSKEAQEKNPTKIPNREVSIDELEKRKGTWYAKGEAEPFTGTEIGYYEDGSKSREVPLVDGRTQGTRIEYYKDGSKKREITCGDGKRHGLQTSWYENGQKSSEENYNDGKRMTAFVWKPNGEKCHDTNLVDGNGITCRYYEKGQKKDEYSYKDGKVHGLGTSWYENGQKASETAYKDGKYISGKYWDEDGSPQ